ncbi:MAG: DUF2817 domain-containing protein, partial [Gammaproteobacteria bacterium]
NIDLNRNFIDFSDIPNNEGYRDLAQTLTPSEWHAAALADIQARIDAYRDRYGRRQAELAVSGGQYQYPDGLFYGGNAPSWSRRNIETIIGDYRLDRRALVAVIDVHSGLGPYGYGEMICDHPPESEGAKLAKRWFGDSVTEPALGTSTSVPKWGLLDYAWHRAFGDRGCYLTLEFGTYSVDAMFSVLCEENYFRQRYWKDGIETDAYRAVRAKLRHFFYPNNTDWKEMVLFRTAQVFQQAIAGLQEDTT